MKKQAVGLLFGVMLVSLLPMTGAAAQDECAQVTLYIFSGRPDPVWTLSASQTQVFQRILETLPPGEAAEIPINLGYRGFEIQLTAQTAYVFGGHVQLTPDVRWLDDPTHALETWLLGTAGDALEPNLAVPLWTQFANLPQSDFSASSPAEGFAIYLVTGDMTPTEVAHSDVSTLPLHAEPVIRMDDISIYHAATHEFELTTEGQGKLAALQVPVSGIPFVVCVNGEAIYAGAFWASYSSLSYHASIVLDVLLAQSGLPVRLDLGYPGSSAELYTGVDLRSDPRILAAFEQAGKLD